jgi:hypothetical protein
MDLEVPCLLLLETALTGEVDLSLLLLPPPPPPMVELCVFRWDGRARAFAGDDVADLFPLLSDREPSWFDRGSFLVDIDDDAAVAFAFAAVVFEVPLITRAGGVDLAEEDCPARATTTALGRLLLDCCIPLQYQVEHYSTSTK